MEIIFYLDFGGQPSHRIIETDQQTRPKRSSKIILRIDDEMATMDWLKNFKRNLKFEKLEYKDNEYESSGFDPLNIVIHDSKKENKKDIQVLDVLKKKQSLNNFDFHSFEVNINETNSLEQ